MYFSSWAQFLPILTSSTDWGAWGSETAFLENGGDIIGPEFPLTPQACVPRDLPLWNLEFILMQVTKSHMNNEKRVGFGLSVCVTRGLSLSDQWLLCGMEGERGWPLSPLQAPPA